MNLDDYIKDFAPELQEKARACGSVEELLALAKDANVPLPDEVLATVAGGSQPDPENCKRKIKCPKCGSTHVKRYFGEQGDAAIADTYECNDCGCIFLA